jgi:hypothetical protein
MSASSTPASSYSPFGQQQNTGASSSASFSPPTSSSPETNAENPLDTSEAEQKWREDTPQQGDWWNEEKLDFYTTLGNRATRSFTGSSVSTSTSMPTSSYSPFGQQNPGTSASFSPPTSNAIIQQNNVASNNGSSQPSNLDANQQEQEWRDSTSSQGGWWNEEKLDYYTDKGMRVTRSFTGEGTRTDISSNNNNWQ